MKEEVFKIIKYLLGPDGFCPEFYKKTQMTSFSSFLSFGDKSALDKSPFKCSESGFTYLDVKSLPTKITYKLNALCPNYK